MNKFIFSRVWETLLLVAVVCTLFVVGTTLTRAEDVPQTDATVVTNEVITETTNNVTTESTDEGALFVAESTTSESSTEEVLPVIDESTPETEGTPDSEGELIVDDFSAEPTIDTTDTTIPETDTQTTTISTTSETSITENTPELTTDKPDYEPGETVTIFGRFFAPVKSFIVRIFGNSEVGNHYSDVSYDVTSDTSGFFSLTHILDNFYRPIYNMIASDEEGNVVAEGQFTDGPGDAGDLWQAENGGVGEPIIDPVDWVKGNVNDQKGHYVEGESIPYRLVMTGLTPNVPSTVVIGFDVKQSSKMAIDYITSYDRIAETVTPCTGIAGCNPLSFTTTSIPPPAYTGLFSGFNNTNVLASFNSLSSSEKLMTLFNGSINSIVYTTSANLSLASSETWVQIVFVPTSETAVLSWGGHISSSVDYPGFSAVTLPGSPYHTRFIELNGRGGNQDRSLAASAVVVAAPQGTIIVDKVTNPAADPQSFTFTTGGTGYTGFSLTDAATPNSQALTPGTYSVSETVPSGWTQTSAICTSSNGDQETVQNIDLGADETVTCVFTNTKRGALTLVKNTVGGNGTFDFTTTGTGLPGTAQLTTSGETAQTTFTNLDPANTYTLAETVPTGWLLNSATCDNSETINSIDIDPGQTVTCTFTNTKQPTLTVNKVLVPSDDGGLFNLRIDSVTAGTGANVGNGGTTGAQIVSVGAHTVSETAGTNTTLTDYTGVIGGDCAANGSITLAAGENRVCTITNTRNTGIIELQKDFVGTPESVTIKIGTAQNGSQVDTDVLFADGTDGEHTVNAGTYFVSETLTTPANYTSALACYNDVNDSNTVDNGDTAHTVNTTTGEVAIGSNDDVLCVYTNTRNTGTVIIKKVMLGGTDTFTFTGTPNGSISTDGGTIQANVETGAYVGTESAKAGWDLTSVVCDDQNSTGDKDARTANFNVESGETVTCTFTNTKRGSITIEKQTLPDADSASFTFTGDVSGSLSDGQTATQSVVPGTYTSTEATKAGWDLTGISCDDQDSSGVVGTGVATFNVAAGENVTCTFTNTKKGHLIVQKTTLPAADPTSFTISASGSGTITGGGAGSITDATDKDYEVTPGTYSVAETVPAGWDKTGDTCQDVVVAAGETKYCTITNTKRGLITIIKDAINNDAQDFTFNNNFGNGHPATFLLDDDSNGTLSNTRSFEVIPGTFAVSEDPVAGWQQESATCSDQSPVGAIVVSPGETVICTFVNEEYAKIILVKNTIGGDGEFSFGKTGAGFAGTTTLTTNAGTASQTFSDLDQDLTYSVAESVPAGWDLTSAVCTGTNSPASITPNPGETVTCTFTNGKLPTLTLEKTVINDNGGTKVADDFQGKIDGVNQAWGTPKTLTPGSYTASETTLPGYAEGVWGGACATNGSVTLAYGDTKTCTITNDDIQPKLTVTKVVINHGQDKQVSDFPLFVDTTGMTSGVQNGFNAGAHTVSETGDANYTATITGDCASDGSITLALADVKACTITNEEKPSKVVIHKVVINHGLENDASHFAPYTVGATGVTLDATTTMNSGSYVVSEEQDANYTATYSGDCDAQGNITLVPGQIKSCTITNEEKPAKIIVTKVVVNDNGGTKEVNDFPLFVDATGVTSGETNTFDSGTYTVSETGSQEYTATISGDCDAQTGAVTLVAGETKSCTITNDDIAPKLTLVKEVTNDNGGTAAPEDWTLTATGYDAESPDAGTYNLSESNGPAGYTQTSLTCSDTGETQVTSVTLGLGEDVTCTFVNDDIAPILHLRKIVTNDNGGNATLADFTLTANGTGANDLTGTSPVDSGATLQADTFALTETNVAGYSASAWVCVGGTQDGSNITVGIGGEATCTITNNDIAPKLTLVKHVTNDDGGNAQPNDFNLTIGGSPALSGVAQTLDANTPYAIDETQLGGYEFVEITGDEKCADVLGGTVTLDEGDDITCTIVNNDKPAKITLIKNVVNDNGGTAGANDFGLTIGGNPATSGTTYEVDSNTTHALSEAGLTGYAFVDITGSAKCPSVLGGMVTLSEGEEITCTIKNNDIAPILHLRKVVVNNNGGTKTVSDFVLTANGTGANDISGTSPVDSDTGLKADTFVLTETNVAGYSASAWVCDGGSQNGANITLGLGQEATCTITNDDIPARLTIVKDAQPNDAQDFVFGGTLGAFTLDDDAGVADAPVDAFTATKTFNGLSAGAYTVTETQPNQFWKLAGMRCVVTGTNTPVAVATTTTGMTVNLGLNADVTCTFVNERLSPTRTQGFWQTHTAFTNSVFTNKFGVNMTVGTSTHIRTITNIIGTASSRLYGAWYSSIPKTTGGTQRTVLDKARMQLLQQLVTAKLNCAQFGCPSSVQTLITQADAAYAGTSAAAILTSASLMDQYNNSGDSLIVGNTGKATPKDSKSYANLVFWNVP